MKDLQKMIVQKYDWHLNVHIKHQAVVEEE